LLSAWTLFLVCRQSFSSCAHTWPFLSLRMLRERERGKREKREFLCPFLFFFH
jgi:hypothetical protein